MVKPPQVDQVIEGHHNVQLGGVHGNVHITQVVYLMLTEADMQRHMQAIINSAAQQAPSCPIPPVDMQTQEEPLDEETLQILEKMRAQHSLASARRQALYGGRRRVKSN